MARGRACSPCSRDAAHFDEYDAHRRRLRHPATRRRCRGLRSPPRTVGTLAARLFRLLDACDGQCRLDRNNVDDLDACLAGEALGVVFHFEGAEPIDEDLDALEVWYAAGLRSLGLVWSRQNAFAHGVPFRYPSSPDTGPGPHRRRRQARSAGAPSSASRSTSATSTRPGSGTSPAHLDGPLIASHSCVNAICPSARNLTDDQLDAIASSGGLVGINFDVGSLRADGADDADTPLSAIADHARYIADRCGVDHVALGSDFDGATMPNEVPDASAYQQVLAALEAAGFESDEVDRIAWKNWRRVLAAAWR